MLNDKMAFSMFYLIGQGMNGILLIVCGLIGNKNMTAAIIVMCIATACATFTLSGFHTTHLDIAPNFAGVLAALTSFGNHMSGVIAPLTVGLIVKNNVRRPMPMPMACIILVTKPLCVS